MSEQERRVSFLRHAGWFSPSLANCRVIVIGCGAVGSNAALQAARMGFMRFDLWDKDDVEGHNLPNQAYDVEHIGMPKVSALEAVLRRFNPEVDVTTHCEFFTEESEITEGGPLILATDSFDSRRIIAKAFRLNPDVQGVFETRLGFDYGQVNILDNTDSEACDNWEATLGNDAETPDGPCNKKICGTLVGSTTSYLVHQMCSKFVAEAAGETWDYKARGRTLFQLADNLTVYTMVRKNREEGQAT